MHSSLISSYWFTLFVYKPTQNITFHYSCIQCLCLCLSFLLLQLISISSSLDNLHENPLKLVISIFFPNKSSYSFPGKIITLSSLCAFKSVLFILAWLRMPETCPCILRLPGKRPSHEVPASFMLLLGIVLFDIVTLIWGILNLRLHQHQYFYWGTISRWLPTKARDSPAPNFLLEFSSLRKVANQG